MWSGHGTFYLKGKEFFRCIIISLDIYDHFYFSVMLAGFVFSSSLEHTFLYEMI